MSTTPTQSPPPKTTWATPVTRATFFGWVFFVFLSILGISVGGLHVVDKQAAIVHTQQLGVWNQCEKSRTNTTKINTTDRAFVSFIRSLPQPTDAAGKIDVAKFESIYLDAQLAIPECGPRPK